MHYLCQKTAITFWGDCVLMGINGDFRYSYQFKWCSNIINFAWDILFLKQLHCKCIVSIPKTRFLTTNRLAIVISHRIQPSQCHLSFRKPCKRGCLHISESEKELCRGSLTLFILFWWDFCKCKRMLYSSLLRAVDWVEYPMRWLSLMLDIWSCPHSVSPLE